MKSRACFGAILICIIIIILGLASVESLSCEEQWQCSSVSSDYNYAACNNGTCVCNSNGFSGSASAESPCICEGQVYWNSNNSAYCLNCTAPAKVYYDENGIPDCLDLVQCNEQQARDAHQKAVVTQLYNNLIYPTPYYIMQNPSLIQGLFSANISGRITPVGEYTDLEGTVEYFYALASSTGGSVQDVKFINLISQDNTVAVRVDIFFNATDVTGHKVYNLTQTGFFHFDNNGEIFLYDLTILRLGTYADPVLAVNQTAYIVEICEVASIYCNTSAPYDAYSSFQDCYDHLTSIPFGSFNNAMSNTVVCRIVHAILVPFRPIIHCPHVGPTGGGMCVDVSYDEWYQRPFY